MDVLEMLPPAVIQPLVMFALAILGLVASTFVLCCCRRVTRSSPKANCYKGKRIVITGASRGIGAELAQQYARLGASMVLVARDLDKLSAVTKKCKEIHAKGATGGTGARMEVFELIADLSDKDECVETIEKCVDALGGIDVLVLNAGVGNKEYFQDVEDVEDLKYLFDVNYWANVVLTREALPALASSKGQIVVVSSLSGLNPGPKASTYAASKHALHGFYNSLRFDLRAKNQDVCVTLVCPSYTISSFHDQFLEKNSGKRNAGKFMSTADCCRLIIDGAYNMDRTVIMTFMGKLGQWARPFMPTSMTDRITEKVALGAFDVKTKQG